ncbi:Rieske (2Fe-2S) protein [Caballeronia sp.]|uniref:Rieske (2Fe-2S) protein n=1 Tax=Caballeronia sp. TaxID=1931223 RepID=UPI003C52EC26
MNSSSPEPQAGFLCTLDDISDGGAIEIAAGATGAPGIVVVRRGDDAWAYRNVCPHFSIRLNYEVNTFCTYDAQILMCAHHSAMFRFEDGVCIDGPCQGSALTAIAVRIELRQVLTSEAGLESGSC